MSRTNVKIKEIKEKLDNISGLDGYYVQSMLSKIEHIIYEIDKHSERSVESGTIFEERKFKVYKRTVDSEFAELGFYEYLDDDDTLIYLRRDEKFKDSIVFHKNKKTFERLGK